MMYDFSWAFSSSQCDIYHETEMMAARRFRSSHVTVCSEYVAPSFAYMRERATFIFRGDIYTEPLTPLESQQRHEQNVSSYTFAKIQCNEGEHSANKMEIPKPALQFLLYIYKIKYTHTSC